MRDAGKAIFYLSYLKNSKASGAPPGPRWGSSRRSPRPPSRVGRAPLPTPLPLGAFGASLSKKRLRRLFNIHKRTPPLSKILDPPLYIYIYIYICMYIYIYIFIHMYKQHYRALDFKPIIKMMYTCVFRLVN